VNRETVNNINSVSSLDSCHLLPQIKQTPIPGNRISTNYISPHLSVQVMISINYLLFVLAIVLCQLLLSARADHDDELERFRAYQRTYEAHMEKNYPKEKKVELSHHEISAMTDEELREMYIAKQRDMHAEMNDSHKEVSDKLKGTLSDDERNEHMKRKEMIEKRKQRMIDEQDKKAQQVSTSLCCE
jgi:hypothetical protein